MTREQFDKLKVGDKVIHAFGGVGIVTYKDNDIYTVKDKGFDCGDGMCEVSFAWNEGEPVNIKRVSLKDIEEAAKKIQPTESSMAIIANKKVLADFNRGIRKAVEEK